MPLNTDTVLFTVTLAINASASNDSWPINLLQGYASTTTSLTANDLNDLVLSPAPTNGSSDSIDGIVTVGASIWQNPQLACDVNGDGLVTALDVLMLINAFNFRGSHDLATAQPPTPAGPPFLDPNGDIWLTPADVILVIDYINSAEPGPIGGSDGGEGEQVGRLDVSVPASTGEAVAAATILSVYTHSVGRESLSAVNSVDRIISGESGNVRATTTAIAGGGLPGDSWDVAHARPGISLRSGPSVTLPNAAQEFDLEAFELEDAISTIAGDIARAWHL
ncbi:MAG: dockerin type I domain-containing protein [Planctomycetota bacterium]|nr:dockerin type I domain-containing protein [Planctomycetota bacterium]